MDTIKISVA